MNRRQEIVHLLMDGMVIPAHPLALTPQRGLDEKRQRALSRYYAAAGAGGVAVGVHTTQFAIRDRQHGLLRPVLELAAETLKEEESRRGSPIVRVAGLCGETPQAVQEASLAVDLGYDVGLLSLGALANASDDQLIEHAERVSNGIPLFGFYLQTAVGGRPLSYEFWRRFASIPDVVAIKIAPFDRYQTLDVVRGVIDSGRKDAIALYTGNDDNIVIDLLTEFRYRESDARMVGGLLGHWAVWTKRAVELHDELREAGTALSRELLARAVAVTDCNAALFDAKNGFQGCIAGIHEILRRQGLLQGLWCLDPSEGLSEGQLAEIDRVCATYPELQDDDFVAEHLDDWLR